MTPCPTCEELRARVAELEHELDYPTADRVSTIRRAFCLSRQRATMVLVMYAASGRHLTYTYLAERMGGEAEDTKQLVKSQVHHTRRRLGVDAIATDYGYGYALSAIGMSKIRKALEAA